MKMLAEKTDFVVARRQYLIGWPDSVLEPKAPAPSAEDIIDGCEQLIARAHDHGMRIIGATRTTFQVAFKGTPLEGCYNADKGGEASDRQ